MDFFLACTNPDVSASWSHDQTRFSGSRGHTHLCVGQHDNGVGVLFPYHPPEVWNGVRQTALGGNESLHLHKALQQREQTV